MKFNCGLSASERRWNRHLAYTRKIEQWHRKFVFKKRIGTTCYILQYLECRRVRNSYGDKWGDFYYDWEWREPKDEIDVKASL